MQISKHLKNFIKNIKENSNICIYGSNNIAQKLCSIIENERKDINVKFFIDSKKEGFVLNKPLYKAADLFNHKNEVDCAIIASYSARHYLELIVKGSGIDNVLKIDKNVLSELTPKEKLKKIDVKNSSKVFKSLKDKNLYKLVAEARKDTKKLKKLSKYYYKNNTEIINGYGKANSYSLKHYFEHLNQNAIETAIDAGAYDGLFSILFLQKLQNCKKVYSFEPCYEKFKAPIIDEIIERDERIEIIPKGLWNERTTLEFREELETKIGSGIVSVKKDYNRPQQIITIETETIDDFVAQNNIKVDFIKMDIENAEMNALKGAEKTILKYRPQLAISIYHSDEQFCEIPLYLNNLLNDYNFKIGHYSPDILETVLYAIPKELS